jgi:two-component system response regulator RegA
MSAAFLILDDNDVFAGTLARSLTRRGFRAIVAHSGEEALAAARKESFDYATIDLQLEKDSGLQWVSPLRQALPDARLLVLTGYASIATTVQAIKSGADNYLSKPANVDSILSALAHGDARDEAADILFQLELLVFHQLQVAGPSALGRHRPHFEEKLLGQARTLDPPGIRRIVCRL